jgi:hypothetical protein
LDDVLVALYKDEDPGCKEPVEVAVENNDVEYLVETTAVNFVVVNVPLETVDSIQYSADAQQKVNGNHLFLHSLVFVDMVPAHQEYYGKEEHRKNDKLPHEYVELCNSEAISVFKLIPDDIYLSHRSDLDSKQAEVDKVNESLDKDLLPEGRGFALYSAQNESCLPVLALVIVHQLLDLDALLRHDDVKYHYPLMDLDGDVEGATDDVDEEDHLLEHSKDVQFVVGLILSKILSEVRHEGREIYLYCKEDKHADKLNRSHYQVSSWQDAVGLMGIYVSDVKVNHMLVPSVGFDQEDQNQEDLHSFENNGSYRHDYLGMFLFQTELLANEILTHSVLIEE